MSNININAGLLDCGNSSSPNALTVNMGTTYRAGQNYLLNYNWNSALYDSYGLPTDVLLRYAVDGGTFVSYPGTLPDNATNFQVSGFPLHDTIAFQFEFQVSGGSDCYLYINVPYSSIVISP